VHVERAKKAILDQEDTNRDLQVTIEDTGPKTIRLGSLLSGGLAVTPIHGNYMISSLLQELAIHSDTEQTSAVAAGPGLLVISDAQLRENPVDRLLRMIVSRFWSSLVRRIDAGGLEAALVDSKNRTEDKRPRIYVPYNDQLAQDYYAKIAQDKPSLNLDVQILPSNITPQFVASIRHAPGLLSLALTTYPDGAIHGLPFVVPGGRFNEMYGWDSYFCALGLLEQPDPTGYYLYVARSMVDNLVYEIEHYGKILNANRSYYLTRSQPPFLTAMASKVYEKMKCRSGEDLISDYFKMALMNPEEWLGKAFEAAIKEYNQVWNTKPRHVTQYGLNRYYDEGIGIPMETESSHYEAVLSVFAQKWNLSVPEFIEAYNSGDIKEPELDAYFVHDRALRESGHDTTYRFEGRTIDLLTVDLNAILYRYEVDIADYLGSIMDIDRAEEWRERATARKKRMYKLMWDGVKGLWYDYDFVDSRKSEYESVTSFWTLWAGLVEPGDAETMVQQSLSLFEVAGGLVAGTEASRGPLSLLRPNRQWDYPYGWAPHQMLAWEGLQCYGYHGIVRRLAYRWLYMITKCFADYNAVVPEKFDAVARSHKVSAEYGNVGTDFQLVPREGFGWMNASYQVGLRLLGRQERRALELLIPPERLFKP